jgi:tetratricopeptide (TPR) repeat protein
LSAVGVEIPGSMQGASLVDLLKKGELETAERPAYAETDYPHRAFGWSSLRAWRAGKYLYIDAPHRELYDQVSDPKALHNLADTSPAVEDIMRSQLEEFRRKTSGGATTMQANITPDQAERLQALGYVTSAATQSDAQQKETGSDPKDKIEVANWLHQALLAVDDERYKDAVPLLQQVLKQEPGLALATLELGRALNGLGNFSQALPWLQKAVELNPQSGRAHFELGVALGETGDWGGSAAQLEVAQAHAPDSEDIHFYLAMAYDKIGRTPDAEKNFRAALQINPSHYQANLFLGRLLGMQNNPSDALPFLQKAVKLQPQSPDAHKFLANVYTELGQEENARRERAEADRLGSLIKP